MKFQAKFEKNINDLIKTQESFNQLCDYIKKQLSTAEEALSKAEIKNDLLKCYNVSVELFKELEK